MEPATHPVPETLPQGSVAKPIRESSPQPAVAEVPEQTTEPWRSARTRTEPSWFKDYVNEDWAKFFWLYATCWY